MKRAFGAENNLESSVATNFYEENVSDKMKNFWNWEHDSKIARKRPWETEYGRLENIEIKLVKQLVVTRQEK